MRRRHLVFALVAVTLSTLVPLCALLAVDIYLHGCPPRPEMLLDSILKLHDKIMNMKLGKNRERQITELEEARLNLRPLHLIAPEGSEL